MPIIPNLPGCGQPATIRFEVWTPQNGQAHGSLDAVAYACDRHALELRTAIHAAGFTPYQPMTTMPAGRVCGHFVDFGAPIPPAITHYIAEMTIPPVPVPLPAAEPDGPGLEDVVRRAAVAALDAFGAVTQGQARTLLGLWARRAELVDADIEAIVARYPASLRGDR